MSIELYLKNALQEVENKWENLSKMFPRQSLDILVPTNLHPKIDESKLLKNDDVQLYQSCIGMLRWAVELGRIDLAKTTGTIARFSSLPRKTI